MRAVVLVAHGGPDRLVLCDDVPAPVPAPGEALVRVLAAGVNATDINTRLGWYAGGGWTGTFAFPRVQGIDACGIVTEVGDARDVPLLGRRVLVEPCWREPGADRSAARFLGSEVDGAFAEYLVAPVRHVHAVESGLSDVALAALPCSWSTAENMLHRAGVATGDRVLVTGASGGVGSAAVALARARGAEVTALTSAGKYDAVLALGATATLDRNAVAAHAGDAFDVVIDVVGGEMWSHLLRLTRPGGRCAVAGAVGGPQVTLDLRTLYLKDLTLFGCTVLDDGVFGALVGRIERGEVHPAVAATFDLFDIAAAQDAFLHSERIGKIVLRVADDQSA